MLDLVKVLGGVAIRGIVATADVAALETEPEVDPFIPGVETLFAALRRFRRDVVDMREMRALLSHAVVP
jgi:hypothetical protein